MNELLTPKEIKDTLFDLKVRESCLGRKVTPLKKYDALLYAQLAHIKLLYPIMYQEEAEEVSKFLDYGWIPPAEAEKLKEVLKHRLDRPDREKIASEVWCCSVNMEMRGLGNPLRYLPEEFVEQLLIDKQPYYETADQILALFPDEEEIRKQERERIRKRIKNIIKDWTRMTEEENGEEHFQDKYGMDTTCLIQIIEQALKEGK